MGIDPLYFSTLCVYFYAKRERVMEKAKSQTKRDAGVNSLGLGDSSQGSHPSENTSDPSSKACSEPKVPTGSSKKNAKLKIST